MKSFSSWKKPLYSGVIFFGTLVVLSIGYATWNTTMGSVGGGDSLSSIKWNAFVDNINDLNTRITNLSTSTFQMLGRGPNFDFNNLTSNAAGIYWADGGGTNLNGPIGGGNSVGHVMQFEPLYSSNTNKYRMQISNPQDNYLYWRDQSNGTWKNWRRFISEDPSGNVGIGTTSPSQKLEVNGSILISDMISGGSNSWQFHTPDDGRTTLYFGKGTNGAITSWPVAFNADGSAEFGGNVIAKGVTLTSDINLKKNIKTLSGGLDKILSIRGVTFDWKDKINGAGSQVGVIAQEVEQVLPETVHTDEKGIKSVNYAGLTAPLIESVKELKKENDKLKQENIEIRARLERLEQR